jgi:hypothetical protein
MARRVTYLCGVCATPRDRSLGDGAGRDCPECGSDLLLEAVNGHVLSFPAGTVPCPECGSSAEPLVFRGWVRLGGFLFSTREVRGASYLCRACAEKQATTTLLLNAVLGWWSIPSFFFYGWRAMYHNWRAAWTSPLHPGAWGAIDAEHFAESVRREREAVFEAAAEEMLAASPLRFLTHTQQALVLGAGDLYELIRTSATSSLDEIRAAYRARCKQVHPDLHTASADATEQMIRLNHAWEILSSDQMRKAYDWLELQRTGAAA